MIRKIVLIAIVALVLGLPAAWPALAHHGSAAFDDNRTVTLKGTVTQFQFMNPHVLIYLDRNDPSSGNLQHCVVEWMSPRMALFAGWYPSMMKPGDQIVYDVHPGKNGTCIGRGGDKIVVNGKQFGQ